MRRQLVELLRCPECRGEMTVAVCEAANERVKTGTLSCRQCDGRFEIRNFVPRLMPPGDYVASFGLQWNEFRETQLDSRSGVSISRERFFRQTGWRPGGLSGRRVLDVGCGSGRFAEVALQAGAYVVAIDYSVAVDACQANLGGHPRLDIIQADLHRLPFKRGQFDFVYCLGVLQHTPDPARAVAALAGPLRKGGRLAIDVYPKLRRHLFWPKYWLRSVTVKVPPRLLFRVVRQAVPILLPFSTWLGRVPWVGRWLRYGIPVMNYHGVYPLTRQQLLEWAVLDTFDMLASKYDFPQSEATVQEWFERGGWTHFEVFRSGVVVGRAIK